MFVTARREESPNFELDNGHFEAEEPVAAIGEDGVTQAGSDDGIDVGGSAPLQAPPAELRRDRKADVTARLLETLTTLAADPDRFAEVLAKAFGPNYDREAAEQIRQKILAGDTSWLPNIELASDDDLRGAKGAYAADNGTVYINENIRSPKRAAEVALEEVGHHLDKLLNRRDSAGDEGEIFRRLVVGENLSDRALTDLRSENDHGFMVRDGELVEVENWRWPIPLPWPFGGGGGGIPPVVRDLVKESADRIVSYVAGFPERIKGAVQGWVNDLVANAKAFGEDLMRSMEKVTQGLGKIARGDLSGLADIAAGMGNVALDGFHAFARFTMDTISAVQTAAGLEPVGRPLRQDEIDHLRKTYGDSIDYSKVTIKEGSAGILAGNRPIAMGNTIYMKDRRDLDTLVHEMAHVWQFQNGGNDYMLKAGWAQFWNWAQGNESRVAYDWTTDIQRGFAALNPEQQAHFIEDLSEGSPSYVDRIDAWNKQWAEYEQKEAAFRAKYPQSPNKFFIERSFQIDGLVDSGFSGGGLSNRGVGRIGGDGGGFAISEDFARLQARRALDAERAALLGSRPQFTGENGQNYTAQADDALWQVRNGVGAP